MIKYFVIALLFFSCQGTAQNESEVKEVFIPQGKWKLEGGIGIDYGIIGTRIGRKVHNNLYAVGAIGINPVGIFWNVGVEAAPKKYLIKYLTPYIRLSFGTQGEMSLTTPSGYLESRFLEGPILGIGVIGKLRENYITIGISYPVNTNEGDRFLEEFISDFATINQPINFTIRPSVGLLLKVW